MLLKGMRKFKEFCVLFAVVDAIDCTHFEIKQPKLNVEDYQFFKIGG